MISAFAFETASWPETLESLWVASRSRITSPAIQMEKMGIVLYKESGCTFRVSVSMSSQVWERERKDGNSFRGEKGSISPKHGLRLKTFFRDKIG